MTKRTIIFTLLLSSFTFCLMAQTDKKDLPLKNTISDAEAEVPPELERNYDQLLSQWGSEMRYGDNCISRFDENVNTPDSIYINRLYALPTRMEMAFNPLVRSYIEMYAGRRRDQVSYMLGIGKYYFPIFEAALDKEGIPLELKYLPVIESALNPIARSRVGATGLWQFMAPTGRMYDLEINSLVDERRDPLRSTAAAAKYLKDLYNIYNDWNLVIAAYNCGPGNVNKAIRRSGGLTDYWAIYPYLPRETRGYVPIFIAATYIMNYYHEHNICPAYCELPASMDTLNIDGQIHFRQIAEVINVPVEDIRKYNPQFTQDIIPGTYKQYGLNLPIDKLTAFIDKKEDILTYKTQELLPHRKVAGVEVIDGGTSSAKGGKTYKVKRGDSLSKIASRNGITVAQLKSWNNLKSNKVTAGKYLIVGLPPKENSTNIPDEELALTENSDIKSNKAVPQTEITYYKIQKGDTWAKVAKKNNASIADIKKWNNIKNNSLIAGKSLKIQKTVFISVEENLSDTLKLPEPHLAVVALDSASTAGLIDDYIKKIGDERDETSLPLIEVADPKDDDETPLRKQIDDKRIIYHKVKIGETMTQIATRYNVSKKDIVKWNKLTSSTAKVGQRLLIHLPEKEA